MDSLGVPKGGPFKTITLFITTLSRTHIKQEQQVGAQRNKTTFLFVRLKQNMYRPMKQLHILYG